MFMSNLLIKVYNLPYKNLNQFEDESEKMSKKKGFWQKTTAGFDEFDALNVNAEQMHDYLFNLVA